MSKAKLLDTRMMLALATRVFADAGNQVINGSDDKEASKITLANLIKSEAVPTDAELANADAIVDEVNQRIMLNELKGTRIKSEFINNVFNFVQKPTAPAWAASFLIWAPKVLADLQERDAKNLTMQSSAVNSEFFGKAGDKITLDVKVVECRFVTHIGKFSVVAKTAEENFVTFWFGKSVENTISIKGRIKGHRTNPFVGNAKTTLLNFVKVVN